MGFRSPKEEKKVVKGIQGVIDYCLAYEAKRDELPYRAAGPTDDWVPPDTGNPHIQPIDQIHKFRKYRVKIPRDQQEGRFRSTYFKVSLYFDNSVNLSLTLQRIMAFFDIQTY
jgi:hypothetical protein